ncbi:MAG: hypothetical protein FWG02_09990, partial [Holophagaceae bacterium]|nr:hypothetical protein [Holophagaceae bacterium]
GDMVSNIDDAVLFLKKHLRLSFKIEGLRRENILELPEDALREAIVNAVCHRDYFENGARVMVEIFDDRVDIVSPGGVCKGITEENFGTVSITRNSVLASMLYRIDYIEQMGTGIMRMKKAARDAEVSEPEFKMSGFFRVTFKRNESQSLASDKQMGVTKKSTSANYGQTIGKLPTSDKCPKTAKKTTNTDRRRTKKTSPTSDKRAGIPIKTGVENGEQVKSRRFPSDIKREIIVYMRKQHRATATEISDFLALSKARVRAILLTMTDDGTIEKVGGNRNAYYVLK